MEEIFGVALVIATGVGFLWREVKQSQTSASRSQANQMPTEASIILAELTQLEINQAEVVKQIERIETGDADILCTHVTTSSGVQLLSQDSFLSALKQEKETLSSQILEKSLEFSKLMGRVGQNERQNERQNVRQKVKRSVVGKRLNKSQGSGKSSLNSVSLNGSDLEELQQILQSGGGLTW